MNPIKSLSHGLTRIITDETHLSLGARQQGVALSVRIRVHLWRVRF